MDVIHESTRELIHITVHYPVLKSTVIEIAPTSTISEIFSMLNLQYRCFALYNRQILSPGFSLNYYGLVDGDEITVLPAVTTSKTAVSNRIDDGLSRVTARLKDLFFTKVERTVVCHRKILTRFSSLSGEDNYSPSGDMQYHPDVTPEEPSTTRLPVTWG